MNAILKMAFFAVAATAPYSGPKTVYILPMAGGLDQYLAQSLTREHLMEVQADPKAAAVVMTDRLGEAFEAKMKELRPDLDKKVKSDKDKDDKTDKDAKSDKGDTDSKTAGATHPYTSSKARGTVFLVDARTRQVLWSEYHRPQRSNSDRDLNRTAEEIVRKLSGK